LCAGCSTFSFVTYKKRSKKNEYDHNRNKWQWKAAEKNVQQKIGEKYAAAKISL
jgi:hypothetical protein